MDVGGWGSLGSAIIALIALARSIHAQRKAGEAVRHAARSADAAERMAKALESSVELPSVHWKLEQTSTSNYLLTNDGRATAYDVELDTGDMATFPVGGGVPRVMEPEACRQFHMFISLGTTNSDVTVTWADVPGNSQRKSWSRPATAFPPQT